ncbi:MAG: hypothetical protein GXY33_15885 [Phycisphaerae bacterium]|nr:hypothetical protein [Phycisphaerae bacterium]
MFKTRQHTQPWLSTGRNTENTDATRPQLRPQGPNEYQKVLNALRANADTSHLWALAS